MTTRKTLLFALPLALLTLQAYAAPQEVTVDKAVEIALANNTSVINAEKTRAIYDQKVREYWGSVYPNISLSASYYRNLELPSYFFGGTKVTAGADNQYALSVNLQQILWAGGKVRTGINIAEIYAKSAREQLRQTQQQIAYNVRVMCYDIVLASATVGIQEESLRLAQQHLTQMEDQYKQGLASDVTVLRQKVEVATTEPTLIQARNVYRLGLLNLTNLLGRDPDNEVMLTDSGSDDITAAPDLAKLYTQALSQRPDIKVAELSRAMAKEQVTLERAGFYPTLYLVGSRSFSGQSNQTFPNASQQAWSSAVGVTLSLPIYSGGATVARISQAELQLQQATETLSEARRNAKIEVKKAWLDLGEAQERIRSQQQAIEQARKVVESTDIRFKNGLASQLELNDATLSLSKTQELYVKARRDAYTALADIAWATGN